MKRMRCEICESTDLSKENGLFVCAGCGAKYSPEEARNLLVEIEGDTPVAPVREANEPIEAKEPVKKELSRQDTNYLELAKRAVTSGNHKEAERYCNLILEGDPVNSDALLYKGAASVWQSTFAHLRTDECIVSWETAFANIVDEEERNAAYAFTDKTVSEVGKSLFTIAAGFADSGVYPNTFPNLRNAVDRTISFILSYRDSIHPSFDAQEILDEGGLEILSHLHIGAQAIEDRFHDQKPTTPTVCTDYHKEVLYFSTICETFGGYGYFSEPVRASFYRDGALSFPLQASQMGGYVWFDGKPCHRSIDTDYSSVFFYLNKKANDMDIAFQKRRTEEYWKAHGHEKSKAKDEIKELEKRIADIPDQNAASETIRLINKRIETLKNYLNATHTEKDVSETDLKMLDLRKSFIEGLADASDYDDYLNEHPVVKKGRTVLDTASKAVDGLTAPKGVPLWTCFLPIPLAGLGVGMIFVGEDMNSGFVKVVFGYIFLALVWFGTLFMIKGIIDDKKKKRANLASLESIKKTVNEICDTPVYEDDVTKVAERKTLEVIAVVVAKKGDVAVCGDAKPLINTTKGLIEKNNPDDREVRSHILNLDKFLRKYKYNK